MSPRLAAYDIERTYDENYDSAPSAMKLAVPALSGSWQLAGVEIDSPFGVAAGPLLNGRWCEYYAALGFDWVTYKTVRSGYRESYGLPNLQPLQIDESLKVDGTTVKSADEMNGSWAVSFGMPSKSPDVWRKDVEQTRRRLAAHAKLSVSVVGTATPNGTLEDLADDYAICAQWAEESGADFVEANFSCPNVCTRDGQLFQQPEAAALVAQRIKSRLIQVPLLIKIGFVPSPVEAKEFAVAMSAHCDALVTTNGVAAHIERADGTEMFDGQLRGVAGDAIREAALDQVDTFHRIIKDNALDLQIVGVGGISNASHVQQFLNRGAACVQLASAVMTNPECGLEIRKQLSPEGL